MFTITNFPRFVNKVKKLSVVLGKQRFLNKIPSRTIPSLFHNLDNNQFYSVTKKENVDSITDTGKNTNISINSSFDRDMKLQNYMKKVSRTTGIFLGTTALSGATTLAVAPLLANNPVVLGTGYICAVASTFYHVYKFDSSTTDDEKMKRALALHIGMGIMISPSLFMFGQFIPHALVTTSACVLGPIVASLHLPKGKLLRYGPVLYTGLFGLIGVGFTGIGASLLGFGDIGAILHSIDLYGGVALFMVYNAYDTHVMIKEYEDGKLDHIAHSTNYSLNSINIFIRLLEIFSKLSNPSKE